MPFAALERILQTERLRQRAAQRGGFSTPGLCFMAVEPEAAPLLASNMRGKFQLTRRNAEGMAPLGFSECPVGQEGPILNELHRTIWDLSVRENWSNRCTAVAEAVDRLRASGVEPKSLVVSENQVAGLLGPDFDFDAARRSMAVQGFVTMVDGMQLLLSDLPDGCALVAGPPAAVGIYMRVGDHLGMLFQRVNRVLMVVRPHVA
jgi:hypothetical protein